MKSGTLRQDARHVSILLHFICRFPEPDCSMERSTLIHRPTFQHLNDAPEENSVFLEIEFVSFFCFYHGINFHTSICSGRSITEKPALSPNHQWLEKLYSDRTIQRRAPVLCSTVLLKRQKRTNLMYISTWSYYLKKFPANR